jgi:uncharacterized protein YkwD
VLLAATALLSGQAEAVDAAPVAVERVQALDHAILLRLNETRARHRLRAVVFSRTLDAAAASHSRSMLEHGFFAHESFDGSSFDLRIKRFYRNAGYASWSAGENLIFSTGALDADTAIKAWLASPEHRRNMLDPSWREIGIASMHATSAAGPFGGRPTWVVTMDFGTRTGSTLASNPNPASVIATKPTR